MITQFNKWLLYESSSTINIHSKEFKNWFGDWENDEWDEEGNVSIMVDKNGEPKIMYHGSPNDFEEFDSSKGKKNDAGWLGEGIYFYDNEEDAGQYGKVKGYYLNIRNPYFATNEDNENLANANDPIESKKFTDRLKSEGYDGVYYNGNLRGETVVFDNNQVRRVK